MIPAALQNFSKYDGHWIAAPVNIHSTNWMWANKAVLDKAGVTELPTDWDGLIAALDKLKASGVTPIAHGGQPWQDATVFEGVVVSTGGPEFYKKALNDFDPEALGSDTMKTVFDRMTQLRGYFDDNFSGRDWNLSTAMVMNGKAGIQFMGDWAKGEFINAGKVPGTDFVCARFPGTQGTVLFNADQFVMFAVGDDKRDGAGEARQRHREPGLPDRLQQGEGLGPGAHRHLRHGVRRLRQEGHEGPCRGQRRRHAVRLARARARRAGGGQERRLRRRDAALNGDIATSDEAVTALADAVGGEVALSGSEREAEPCTSARQAPRGVASGLRSVPVSRFHGRAGSVPARRPKMP